MEIIPSNQDVTSQRLFDLVMAIPYLLISKREKEKKRPFRVQGFYYNPMKICS